MKELLSFSWVEGLEYILFFLYLNMMPYIFDTLCSKSSAFFNVFLGAVAEPYF